MNYSRQLRILFLLLVFFAINPLFAQLYEVTRYADKNGLPSRIVRDVDQDADGFLWVAGHNGLFKFDGIEFHSYYANLNDTTGLRDSRINAILAAKNGTVWAATPKGLHKIKNNTITFVSLSSDPNSAANHTIDIFEDSRENIWVSTYLGFYRIDPSTDEIQDFSFHNPHPTKDYPIWAITEDLSGRIWVCQGKRAPLVSEKNTFNFTEASLQFERNSDKANFSPYQYLAYGAERMLVTSKTGLYSLTETAAGQFLIQPFYDEKGNNIATEFLYNTMIDGQNYIWTATWRNKIKKYKLIEGVLIEQEVIGKNGWENMGGHARGVYEDAQKNIWVSNTNGLYKLSDANTKFDVFPPSHVTDCLDSSFSVYSIAEDTGGHLWITTSNYLYRFKKDDIVNNRCPTDYLKYTDAQFAGARNILIDSSNRLWVSGQRGVSIAQLDENYSPISFYHVTDTNGLPNNRSTAILEENSTTFWLGNHSRLLLVTIEANALNTLQISEYESDNTRDDALVNSFTLHLGKDNEGNLWAGTYSGLSRLISAEDEGTFKNYESVFGNAQGISNNSIKSIFSDHKGRLWIGTQTGLNLYQPKKDTFIQFGRNEGLPSEYILGIQEDTEQNLWVATTSGIFKGIYNESMQGFVHIEYISSRDGLADNITNINALHIDDNNTAFIGSSAGLTISKPTQPNTIVSNFNLAITTVQSIQKQQQGLTAIKNRIKDGELTLSHTENSIELVYAVLDFTDPEHNQYRHKFLPINDDWIETGTDSKLDFYNLSSGTYELLLDGSNNQGVWSQEPIRLKITILPPFWKSKWAFLLYGLLLLGAMRLLYVMRIRKKVRELEQETRLEKALLHEREQLRTENAADFHDELGSKVTKISMFLTLAERTLKEQKDPSSWFGKIRENITDLSGSFRDLLWVIDPKKDSLGDAFLRLKDFGEDLFNNTSMHYSTHGYSEILEDIMLDPQTKKQVVLIFKEALHNAAKYANCTKVTLTIETSDNFGSIYLKDNGEGFNVQHQSKGQGLSNMKARSEKMGSTLSIESGKNGTTIHLQQIPLLWDTINGN